MLHQHSKGHFVSFIQTWRLQQTKGQLPHLACRLRELRDEDIRICVQRRRETVGSTHIAYVGDSRVRQHVEVLLDHIRHLQPKITTHLVRPHILPNLPNLPNTSIILVKSEWKTVVKT